MKIFLIFLLLTSLDARSAQGVVIDPLGKPELQDFLNKLKAVNFRKSGIDPNISKIINSGPKESYFILSGGQSTIIYNVDVNNDGENEYLAVYFSSGSLATSGIQSVLSQKLEEIPFQKIISKNLWGDPSGDLSKLPLWLAEPAIVKRDGKIIIRFKSEKPKKVFTEYLWEKNKFKKIRETSKNNY